MELKFRTYIEEKLQNMELEKVQEILCSYMKEYPYDRDLLSYNTIFYLYNGDMENAYKCACLGILQVQKCTIILRLYVMHKMISLMH